MPHRVTGRSTMIVVAREAMHAAAPNPTRKWLGKLLPPVLLAAGGVIFIMGFVLTNTGEDADPVVTQNPRIEELIPAPGSEVLRQSKVGIDLAPGHTAELVLNGVPIPLDQVNVFRDETDPEVSSEQQGGFDSTLNRFEYQPLEGRAVPELKGDENCVVATFWPLSDPDDVDTVEWCFTVA